MKFSEAWLRTLVDPPIDTAALCDKLTMAGFEVEDVAPRRAAVRERRRRRDRRASRRIRMPTACACARSTSARATLLQIVCGAPNAAAGMRAPCALEGAVLPGGLPIQPRDDARRRIAGHAVLGARARHCPTTRAGLLALPADARARHAICARRSRSTTR